MAQLFSTTPLQAFLDSRIVEAAQKVEGLSNETLRDPGLAGRIEALWTRMRPAVPVLLPGQKKGTKRQAQQRFTDYGTESVRDITVLDVRIPFKATIRCSMSRLRP